MKPRKWKRQRLSAERKTRNLEDLEKRKWSHDGAATHPWLIGLFGGASAAAGLTLFVGVVGGSLYGYWRTREQVNVPARLQSVEWVRNGKSSHTSVGYEYQIGSETFTGTRLALFGESRGAYDSLSSTLDAGTPISVFTDPRDPSFSVIDRQFKWWPFIGAIILSTAFTSGGCFLLGHLFRIRKIMGSL